MTVPSPKNIAKVDGKPHSSHWMQKNTMYPYPVAVGADSRVSFFQQVGKPWDWDRVHNLVGNIAYIEHDGERITL